MPDEMNAIKSLPDISFIDNKDIDQVRQEMVADYESFISEATGRDRDPGAVQRPPYGTLRGGSADLPGHAVH